MSADYFTRLEAELGAHTRAGSHLPAGRRRAERRALTQLRRGATMLALAVVLAATLATGFPASAGGYATHGTTLAGRSA